MFGVLAEDKSDVAVIRTLIKRIAGNDDIKVHGKGYNGANELLNNGARQIRLFQGLGVNKFVICYDSDNKDPAARVREIIERIVQGNNAAGEFCALVPIQEIESWILADLNAVSKVITSFRPTKVFSHPEHVDDPKEELQKLCRASNLKPRYQPPTHNEHVAKHLDLVSLVEKCPSSIPLFELVQQGVGNTAIINPKPIKERRAAIRVRL